MTTRALGAASALVAGLALSGVAQAALYDRGGGLIYDTELNITWLQDANFGAGSIYDDGSDTTDGRMTWANALAWAKNLEYYDTVRGVTWDDWRLPFVVDTGDRGGDWGYSGTDNGYNVQTKSGDTVYSELAHMYYVTLGNKAPYDTSGASQTGWGLTNTGPFSNLHSSNYWSGTEYAVNPGSAWDFHTDIGNQSIGIMNSYGYAWAVRPGDVPLPGAGLLLMSARRAAA